MMRQTIQQPETPASEQIINTVADFEDVEPTALPQLYETIDPDALDSLVKSSNGDLRIEFEYCGYEVIINGENAVVAIEEDD